MISHIFVEDSFVPWMVNIHLSGCFAKRKVRGLSSMLRVPRGQAQLYLFQLLDRSAQCLGLVVV